MFSNSTFCCAKDTSYWKRLTCILGQLFWTVICRSVWFSRKFNFKKIQICNFQSLDPVQNHFSNKAVPSLCFSFSGLSAAICSSASVRFYLVSHLKPWQKLVSEAERFPAVLLSLLCMMSLNGEEEERKTHRHTPEFHNLECHQFMRIKKEEID